jgi:hypothetical protein
MSRFTKTTAPNVKLKGGSWRSKTSKEDSRDKRRRTLAVAMEAGNRERRNAKARAQRRTRAMRNNSGLLDPLVILAFKLLSWVLLLPFRLLYRGVARLFRRQ